MKVTGIWVLTAQLRSEKRWRGGSFQKSCCCLLTEQIGMQRCTASRLSLKLESDRQESSPTVPLFCLILVHSGTRSVRKKKKKGKDLSDCKSAGGNKNLSDFTNQPFLKHPPPPLSPTLISIKVENRQFPSLGNITRLVILGGMIHLNRHINFSGAIYIDIISAEYGPL